MGLNGKTLVNEDLATHDRLLRKFDQERRAKHPISFPKAPSKHEILDDELTIPNFVDILNK